MIKTLNNVGIEGMHLNIIKAIENKTTANILISEKLKAFFKIRSKKKMSTLTMFIQHRTGSLTQRN